jgi:hypothetical protein
VLYFLNFYFWFNLEDKTPKFYHHTICSSYTKDAILSFKIKIIQNCDSEYQLASFEQDASMILKNNLNGFYGKNFSYQLFHTEQHTYITSRQNRAVRYQIVCKRLANP